MTLGLFVTTFLHVLHTGFSSDCSIALPTTTTAVNFPVLLDSDLQFIYPTLQGTSRIISIKQNDVITVGCPGSGNALLKYSSTSVQATCKEGTTFQVNGASADFTNLYCKSAPKESVVTSSTGCGTDNSFTWITIGYPIGTNFINLIGVCFNSSNSITLFTVSTVFGPAVTASDISNARPSFKEGSYYPTISCSSAYSQKTELATVSTLVGSDTLGAKYINVSNSEYFAKGHLSPDGDFIYTYQQNATYYFINVVPQWQCINNGNWKYLENSVRSKARTDSANLTVYSGIYNILQLPDENQNLVDIYLAKDSTGYQLPAPILEWKVVHDVSANTGVAIVNVNNPHLTTVPSEYIVCESVCNQLTWLNIPDITNPYKGYTYCCTVEDFAKVVSYAPNLGNLNLLT